MDTQLTHEQEADIFALYWRTSYKTGLLVASISMGDTFNNIQKFGAQDRKLLLVPIEKISDEDADKVADILHIRKNNDLIIMHINRSRIDIVKSFLLKQSTGFLHCGSIDQVLAYQYLTKKGYTVPLFIDIDHPDNGKDAIQLGLAIDKTLQP